MNNIISTTTTITINSEPKRRGNAKPVFCITDGTLYASAVDAAKANGLNFTTISAVCRGKFQTARGKQYCFVKDIPARISDISATMQKYYAASAKQFAFEEAQKHLNLITAKEQEITKRKAALEKQEADIGMQKAKAVANYVALGGVM